MSTNQDSSSTSKERESGDLTTSSSTEQQQHRMPSSSLPNQAIHPESQSKSNQPSSSQPITSKPKPTSARKSLSQSSTSANPNSSRISSTSTSNKNAERQSLISAIQQIQSENAKLGMELQSERNRLRLDQSNKRRKLDSQLEDSDWQNQIKVAMQGLEDDQLLSLLTTPITSILEPLNISLPQQSTSLLLDPPISAGIEHTGSALEVDALLERQRKLEEGLSSGAGGNNDFSTISRGLKRSREENERSGKQREIWKVWGKGRVERGDELLSKLADYTSVTITSIQSKSVPSSSSSVRHVEMKGSLLHFGDFRATFEVVEPTIDQPVTETISFRTASGLGPRMRNLKMDLPQTARKVLEAEGHLEHLLSTSSLPAIFISLRTLHSSAFRRRNLFSILHQSFPSLTPDFSKDLVSRGGSLKDLRVNDDVGRKRLGGPTQDDDSNSNGGSGTSSNRMVLNSNEVRALYDPELANKLEFRNQSGTVLILYYHIKFDRSGHSRNEISLTAETRDEDSLSSVALKTLRSLPSNFQRLLQHPPLVPARLATSNTEQAASKSSQDQDLVPLPIENICKATVAAFFGVAADE